MNDVLLYITLIALGASFAWWGARRWWIRPLQTKLGQADIDIATANKGLDECRDEFAQAMTDLAACNDSREHHLETLNKCIDRRDQLNEHLAAKQVKLDQSRAAHSTCKAERDTATRQLAAAERKLRVIRAELADTNTNWESDKKRLEGARAIVALYHAARTAPFGIGDPDDHLTALFAYFDLEYTRREPAADSEDTPQPAPTEST